MTVLLLAACTSPERFQAFALQEGGDYRIAARRIESLEDPRRLSGSLGQGWAGGVVRVGWDTGLMSYQEGRALDILYGVDAGVAEPLDRDGLILYSFYGHLQDAVEELALAGVDTSPLFPLSIAVKPAVADPTLAFLPVENAAYAPGANLFLLLSDLIVKEVPLAANKGVVTHEFGHAVFQLLTVGDPYVAGLSADDDIALSAFVSSLDEGFADMLASLVTDQPSSFEASLSVPERDVSGAWRAGDLASLPGDEGFDVGPLLYDPYQLGTVFASVTWDIRLATDDRIGTLALAAAAVEHWAEQGDKNSYLWLDSLVEVADAEQAEAACASIALRFEDVHSVAACP